MPDTRISCRQFAFRAHRFLVKKEPSCAGRLIAPREPIATANSSAARSSFRQGLECDSPLPLFAAIHSKLRKVRCQERATKLSLELRMQGVVVRRVRARCGRLWRVRRCGAWCGGASGRVVTADLAGRGRAIAEESAEGCRSPRPRGVLCAARGDGRLWRVAEMWRVVAAELCWKWRVSSVLSRCLHVPYRCHIR